MNDGSGAHGTWNINITGRAAGADVATRAVSADTAAKAETADKAETAERAAMADEATLALNIPTYDRGGNIWIA